MLQPKLIEIKGVQFVNKGAELMLYAIIEQVEEIWPDAKIVLAPNPYSPYDSRVHLNAFQKLSLRKSRLDLNSLSYKLPEKVRNYLRNSWGVVTEADIDLVLDASGFAYGDQWGSLKIKHLAGELKRYQQHNIPYVFLPQALGPFTRKKDIKNLKKALPLAQFIAARESTSYENVKSVIGQSQNLHLYPDFTNLVQGIKPESYNGGSNKVLFIPNSNMIGDRNTHKPEWKNTYIDVFSRAINFLQKQGLTPVLLNHEGKDDEKLCQQIRQHSELDIEIIEESHPLKVKGIIGSSKAVVCSRFHGCVSALSQAVPCLGTSWSHKYERLFEDYGATELLLTPSISQSQLSEAFSTAFSSQLQESLNLHSQKLKASSVGLWKAIAKELNEL